MTLADLSIVVVTYNSGNVITDCLEPINKSEAQILVVDNGSADDTVEIAESFGSVQVIRSGANHGFAHAVNQGTRIASGAYILLLNPDAVPDVAVIDKMLHINRQSSGRKILAPRLATPGRAVATLNSGRQPSAWRMFCHFSGLSRIARSTASLDGFCKIRLKDPNTEEADWVSGACLLVSRWAWDMLGGLNERWFMYAEDIDFCLRAKDSGLEVLFLGGLEMEHAIGGSDRTASMRMNSAWVLNLYDLYILRSRPRMIGVTAWGGIVSTGLVSRAFAYRVRAMRSREEGKRRMWRMESNRFARFAGDVLKFDLKVWSVWVRSNAAKR